MTFHMDSVPAGRAFYIAMAAFLACAMPLSAAQPGPQPGTRSSQATPGYNDFRIIPERNIFNPNRYLRSNTNVRQPQRTVRSDSMTLTGVMTYEKGTFAFFEGTRAEYKKVAKLNDKVADFQIARITPTVVTLVSGTNRMDVPVGYQLRKQEEGGWSLAGRAEFASTTTFGENTRGFGGDGRGGRFDRQNRDQGRTFPDATPPGPEQGNPDVFQMIEGAVRNVLGDTPPPPPPGGDIPNPESLPAGVQPGNAAPGNDAGGQPDLRDSVPAQGFGTQPANAQPSNTSNSEDDVLNRLMERRRQEMNQ